MNSRSMRNPWLVIGLILVPMLIAGAFLAGGWGQRSDLGKVKAAIVNLDQMVTVNGQATPLGRQLAVALADNPDENVTWVLTDAAGAARGIESGEYAAVVTIPQNFSKAATSFSGSADTVEQATIQVQTSPAAAVSDAGLARQLAQLATQELSKMLTESYLQNVYIGFNESGGQFVTLGQGATQLSDGARQLADGAKQASTGTAELDRGMRAMATGAGQLKDGTPALVQGATQIKSAGTQVSAGGAQLNGGSRQLANGASQLATGSKQLASGATSLSSGVDAYTQGTAQVVGGISSLNSGIQQLNNGLKAPAGSSQLGAGLTQLRQGSQGVASGASSVSSGASGLNQGLQQYQASLGQLADTAPPQALAGDGSAVEQQCVADGGTAEVCAQVRAAFEQGLATGATGGWKAGLTTAQQALSAPSASGASLIDGAAQLDSGAAQLSSGATQLDGGVAKLQKDLPAQIQQQQAQLAGAVQKVATGSQQLTTRSQGLVKGGQELSSGAKKLASGAQQSASGAEQLSTGVTAYTNGVGSYVTGVDRYTSGVSTLADGVAGYATGAGALADGVVTVADKTPELASGISQLSTGADTLATGAKQFSDGVNAGAEKVPSYSEAQRQQLSKVVANPVAAPETSVVQNADMVPLAVLVMVLGAWLGALALHLLVPPIPRSVLGSTTSTARVMAAAMWPSLALATGWAALLAVIGWFAVRPSVAAGFGLFAVLEVAAVTFVAVNHALAAWLPGPGRLLAVVWAAAAAAVGTTVALPGVFTVVNSFSPLKPAVDGLRAVVSGTSVVGPVAGLVGWLVAAMLLAALAFGRARQLSVKQYQAHLSD